MELLVRNAEGNLSTSDREYAAKKLARLDRYFHQATKLQMVHREEKLSHRIEITLYADGFTIRGEDREATIREAIDKVSDRLESRLKKLKGRIVQSHRRRGYGAPPGIAHEEPEEHDESFLERKSFLLKPMSTEEAMLQMEFVDHPFFVFKNAHSGMVEVLYKKQNGRYGLLEPTA